MRAVDSRAFRSPAERLRLVAAFGAAFLPIVLALIEEARFGSYRPIARGDEAILELHVGQALRFTHLLGPYSQYGWYHPGPLYYYLLAPLYLISGSATRSLHVGVALINLGAVAGMLALALKLERGHLARLVGALVVAGFVSALATRVPGGALITNPLIEIWNPVATVLPFGLSIFVAVAVATGRVELLPLTVFLHAFTIQTHVSYLPPATLLMAGAVAWAIWVERSVSRERFVRTALAGAAVAVVLWLPPVVAFALERPGNARDLVRFAFTDHGWPPVPWGAGLAYGLRQLHAPILYWLGFTMGSGTWLAVLLTAVEVSGAGFCLLPTPRRTHRYAAVLGATTLLLTASALVQSRTFVSLDEGTFYYQTLWFGLVGCFGWLAPVYVLRVVATRHLQRLRLAGVVLVPPLAWVLTGLAAHAISRDFARCRAQAPPRPEPSEVALPVLRRVFDPRAKRSEYVLDGSEPGTGAIFTSTVLEMSKHGTPPILAPAWQLFLGNGARYGSVAQPTLHVSNVRLHDQPLWRGLGTTLIYAARIDRRVATGGNAPGCRVLESKGAVQNTERICDRHVARGKSGQKEATSSLLRGGGAVTVKLDAVESAGAFVEGLRLRVDSRDVIRIEGSRDGSGFLDLGVSHAQPGFGLHWRSFYFNDGVPWSYVRIRREREYRRAVTLEEVAPLLSEGQLLDLGADQLAAGTLSVPLVEGRPYDLTLRLRTKAPLGVSRVLRVSCNGAPVGEVELAPGVLEEYTVMLPASGVRSSTSLGLELVAPGPPGETLARTIDVQSALLRPAVLGP